MVDYPVLESEAAMALIRKWVAEDECDVGAQLNPWVNLPHEEDVTTANSYVGTLPEALERAKLVALRDRMAKATGKQPISFRAGRYGVGTKSHRLRDAGDRKRGVKGR